MPPGFPHHPRGTFHGGGRQEDRILPPKWNEENRFLTKLGGIGYRLAKLSFVDYPLLTVYPYFFGSTVIRVDVI